MEKFEIINGEGYELFKLKTDDKWLSLTMDEFGHVLSTKDKFLNGMDVSYSTSMLMSVSKLKDEGKSDEEIKEIWGLKMSRYKKIRDDIEKLI